VAGHPTCRWPANFAVARQSAAEIHGNRVFGVILSGGNGDGATGLLAIKMQGGATLVQLPEDAAYPSMPRAAIMAGHPNDCLPVEEIAQRVGIFCSGSRSPPSDYHD